MNHSPVYEVVNELILGGDGGSAEFAVQRQPVAASRHLDACRETTEHDSTRAIALRLKDNLTTTFYEEFFCVRFARNPFMFVRQ